MAASSALEKGGRSGRTVFAGIFGFRVAVNVYIGASHTGSITTRKMRHPLAWQGGNVVSEV